MDTDKKFTRLVDDAVAQSLSGWDFSYVKGRIVEADTSWNYRNLVQQQIVNATSMVDLCTGGGEVLDSLTSLPASTYATEGFKPNVPVARKRLEPRGVRIVEASSDRNLPLPSQFFDLVINRHGAYAPEELLRIMRPPGAVFLTQQVGSDNAIGLNQVLDAAPPSHDNWRLDTATSALAALGFSIDCQEQEYPVMSFKDIGAVVFYLQAIPWQIPDFSVAKYRTALIALHNQIESNGSFDTNNHRFLLEARLN